MSPSRRVRMTLGACTAVLLFGLLGLAVWSWWSWHHRSGGQPAARSRRVGAVLVAAGLVVVAVGTVWRTVAAVEPVRACSPLGGGQTAARSGSAEASLVAQEAATWPETGIALLYSQADGGHLCLSPTADYYVGVHTNNIAGARAMTVGDIVLTPRLDLSRAKLRALIGHEARHRVQWAVGTVIGGPLAFPVAYAVDDFFFPGARNQFEREAGLDEGGYSHEGTGPVLGPAQFAALGALAVIIVVALVVAWRRRASRDRTVSADTPGAAGIGE